MASAISVQLFPGTSYRANLFVFNMTSVSSVSKSQVLDLLDKFFIEFYHENDLVVFEEVGTPKKCFVITGDGRENEYGVVECTVGLPKEFQVLTEKTPSVDYWTCQFYPYVNKITQFLNIDLNKYLEQLKKNLTIEEETKEPLSFFLDGNYIFVKSPVGKALDELLNNPQTTYRLDPKPFYASQLKLYGHLIHLELAEEEDFM
jgi:hypothetical protein